MLKIAGSILVLTSGILVRRAVVSKLQASLDACRAMIAALSWMEAQIRLELAPVPRLLPRLSQRASVGGFFAAVAHGIEHEKTLYEAWTDALPMLPICKTEHEILRSLGERLGGEEESVCRALTASVWSMEENFARRREESCERKRLYSAICFASSTLFIIVLL